MEVIYQLGGSSNYIIRCTECAADKNTLGTIENDPVQGDLWVFSGHKNNFDFYVLLFRGKQKW